MIIILCTLCQKNKEQWLEKIQLAFVFQNFELLPGLTAIENVMLPLELKAKNKAKDVAKKLFRKSRPLR